MEKQLRKTAIKRYVNGENPKSIYTSLKRSKPWFFKWLRRYQSGKADWFKDHSKRPHNSPGRVAEIERRRIIETRKNLESQLFAQTGVSAIKWELRKSGFRLPSDRTINRVLKREGLVLKKRLMFPRASSIPISQKPFVLTISTRPILSDRDTLKEMAGFIRSM